MTAAKPPLIVLIVDDEEGIRMLERRVLEAEGYTVIEAGNGLEGIALLATGAHTDLLLADLDMPELGGDEMVRRVRTTRPDLKVLYVTGHIDRLMDARPLWEGEAFLDKPFTAAGLTEAVALLLHGTLRKRD
jgi:two-component system cell cycle sensor histidine kinase/response regulator CckA